MFKRRTVRSDSVGNISQSMDALAYGAGAASTPAAPITMLNTTSAPTSGLTSSNSSSMSSSPSTPPPMYPPGKRPIPPPLMEHSRTSPSNTSAPTLTVSGPSSGSAPSSSRASLSSAFLEQLEQQLAVGLRSESANGFGQPPSVPPSQPTVVLPQSLSAPSSARFPTASAPRTMSHPVSDAAAADTFVSKPELKQNKVSMAKLQKLIKAPRREPNESQRNFQRIPPVVFLFAAQSYYGPEVEPHIDMIQRVVRRWLARLALGRLRRMNAKRRNIVAELLETERTYVSELGQALQVYITPIRERRSKLGLSEKDCDTMFGNLEEIWIINQMILAQVTARWAEWHANAKVADIFCAKFVRLALPMYQKFFQSYSAAAATQEERMESKKSFREFVEKCQIGARCKTLESLFVTPIQRLPRYQMLLSELLMNTWESHPDFENLNEALVEVADMATKSDAAIREKVNRGHVERLERGLQGLAAAMPQRLWREDRNYVMEGSMTKYSRGVSRRRFVCLFNDMLIYCYDGSGSSYKFRCHMPLRRVFLEDVPDGGSAATGATPPNCFVLRSSVKTLCFCTESAREKKQWMTMLRTRCSPAPALAMDMLPPRLDIDAGAASGGTVLCEGCRDTRLPVKKRTMHCRRCGKWICKSCTVATQSSFSGRKEPFCEQCAAYAASNFGAPDAGVGMRSSVCVSASADEAGGAVARVFSNTALVHRILSYVPVRDLRSAASTCRQLYLVLVSEGFWEQLGRDYFAHFEQERSQTMRATFVHRYLCERNWALGNYVESELSCLSQSAVMDTVTASVIASLRSGPSIYLDVSYSGQLLCAACRDGSVHVWLLSPVEYCGSIRAFDGAVTTCVRSQGENILCVSSTFQLCLLNWSTRERVWTLSSAHNSTAVTNALILPDNSSLITSGMDGSMEVRDLSTGSMISVIYAPEDDAMNDGGPCMVSSMCPCGVDLVCVGYSSGVVRLWSISSSRCVGAFVAEAGAAISGVHYLESQSKLIVATEAGSVLYYSSSSPMPVLLHGASAPVSKFFVVQNRAVVLVGSELVSVALDTGQVLMTVPLCDFDEAALRRLPLAVTTDFIALSHSTDSLALRCLDFASHMDLPPVMALPSGSLSQPRSRFPSAPAPAGDAVMPSLASSQQVRSGTIVRRTGLPGPQALSGSVTLRSSSSSSSPSSSQSLSQTPTTVPASSSASGSWNVSSVMFLPPKS